MTRRYRIDFQILNTIIQKWPKLYKFVAHYIRIRCFPSYIAVNQITDNSLNFLLELNQNLLNIVNKDKLSFSSKIGCIRENINYWNYFQFRVKIKLISKTKWKFDIKPEDMIPITFMKTNFFELNVKFMTNIFSIFSILIIGTNSVVVIDPIIHKNSDQIEA